MVITLAVLAIAGTGYADRLLPVERQSNAASHHLAAPPAPEPDVPVIMTSEVNTSVRVQTAVDVESGRQLGPALGVSTVSRHSSVVARGTGKPRFFPLLI
jgi:hypothetical protein